MDIAIYPSDPDPFVIGDEGELAIVITVTKPTRVKLIDVHITCEQGWKIGAGRTLERNSTIEVVKVERLVEPGILSVGTKAFPVRFVLPSGTLASHELSPAWVRLLVWVHASIPWSFDRKRRFVLSAQPRSEQLVVRTPTFVQSTEDKDKRRIELRLDSTHVIPGETLTGSCALFHVDNDKSHTIRLAMVPNLTLRDNDLSERGAYAPSIASGMTIPVGAAGTHVPFELRVPGRMTPTFRSATHDLGWVLFAGTQTKLGLGQVSVSVPLQVMVGIRPP